MQYVRVNTKFVFWMCVVICALTFFSLFSDICFPFFVGFIFAYVFAPAVDYLSMYKYISRPLLSFVLAAGIVVLFILCALELIPKLSEYLIFLHRKIPEYYSMFVSFMNDAFSFVNIGKKDIASVQTELQKFMDQKVYVLASIVEGVASKTREITKFFSFLVIMPLSLFYFLRDWHGIADFIRECIPLQQRQTFLEVSAIIRKTVRSLMYWQSCIVFVLFAYYAVTLRLVGVEHNIYLAIMSGLLSFIPFIGCLFSCFLVIFISIPILTLTKFYLILVIYFVGQFLEGYVLYPHFVGKKTGLHPLWILFSFFAGIELNGIIGVIIAIPMAAVIRSLCVYMIRRFKATQAYKY